MVSQNPIYCNHVRDTVYLWRQIMNYETRWSYQQKDELPDIWDVTGTKGLMLHMPLLKPFHRTPEMRELAARRQSFSLNQSMDSFSWVMWLKNVNVKCKIKQELMQSHRLGIHPTAGSFFVWEVAKSIIRSYKLNLQEFIKKCELSVLQLIKKQGCTKVNFASSLIHVR